MEILIGLLIIAAGSFGQSSSYVPIRKVREWSWESFWLVQGIFAWIIFPLAGALAAVPEGHTLADVLGIDPKAALSAAGYGVLWGVGGLTFGLSMRYLGVSMGQSISLGTCAAFGTLFPAIMAGTDLFHGDGLILLAGVCITLAGISVIGYAGSLRSKGLPEEERKAAIVDYSLTKGLAVALLAGVMSACFALGLDAGGDRSLGGGGGGLGTAFIGGGSGGGSAAGTEKGSDCQYGCKCTESLSHNVLLSNKIIDNWWLQTRKQFVLLASVTAMCYIQWQMQGRTGSPPSFEVV